MINKLQYISTQDPQKPKPENMRMNLMENNYVEHSSKIPKSIKMFFLTLHLVFGQDFGFGNLLKKKTAEFVKYYSTVLAFTTIMILALPFKLIGYEMWYWWTLVECLVNFCIMKTATYTVYNLLSDIHAAGRIDVLESETFGVITFVYVLVMFIVKGIVVALRCMYDSNLYCERMNYIYLAFYALCCNAVDLMPEAQIVVRFYIYAYVNNIERSLDQGRDMNKLIEKYNKIADCQDKIRHVCDYFTLMELVINVPKLMNSLWFMLDYIKKERKWFTTMAEWVFAFQVSAQIVIPAIIVQLIKCKLDDIRHLLNKWIIVERDPEKNAEIVRVMKYLNMRSLQYKIWGIIPTDANLPLTLISVCTTYLIVIIQFTHLYD